MFGRLMIAMFLALPLLAAQSEAGEVGFVTSIEGVAHVRSAALGEPQSVKLDRGVSIGETVSTGSRSSLRVVLDDDTIVSLGPDTEVVFERLVVGKGASTQRSILRETKGHVRVNVGSASSGGTRMEVQTPTALLEISGSVVEIVVSGAGGAAETLAVCVRGVIKASSADRAIPGTVEVSEGMSTRIRQGKPPTEAARPPVTFRAMGGSIQKATVSSKGTASVLGVGEDKALVEATEKRLLKRETLDATNVVGKSVGPEEVFEQGNQRPRTP